MQVRSKVIAAVGAVTMLGAACGGGGDVAAAACDGEIPEDSTVQVWAHEGQEAEIYTDLIDQFNSGPGAEAGVTAELTLIPEGEYTNQIQSAAAADDLPDVLDVDGPVMANFAWSGSLVPLDDCIDDDLRANLLPSIEQQGQYADRLWAIGSFDSGLGLWSSRSVLEEVGARIPEGADDAWTAEEFDTLLRDLQAAGYEAPLDTKFWYGAQGEWFSYGYQPIVWSGGADLIDLSADPPVATGQLNSPEAVAALEQFQTWVEDGLVDTDAVDDSNFLELEAPVSWVGHWMYTPYKEALGDDLVLLPLPDFGTGSNTGMGSWAWAMASGVEDPDAAWAVIEFFLQDDVILSITEVNGAVPATQSAVDRSELHAEGGELRLYVEQLNAAPDVARPRPQTPAYPTLTSEFASSLDDIIQGADVQSTLDEAATAIDEDITTNEGYPEPEFD